MLRRCALALLLATLALACHEDGAARLSIVFPDENARTQTTSLEVWVLRSHGPACAALVNGSVSTDDQKLEQIKHLRIPYPVVGATPDLGKIPLGDYLFFVEGMGAQGGALLRGCTDGSVSGSGALHVTVELVWVCQPREEVCHNGLDDDCDGAVDEDCPDCTADADCEDGNPCTIDLCLGEACHHDRFPDDTRCSDGDRCTVEDRCVSGECRGSDKDCSAYDGTCLVGACDGDTGECEPTPVENGSTCSDGLWCTVGDACQDGACVGQTRDCADADDLCTQDTCREGAGEQGLCEHTSVPRPGAEGPPADPSCSDGIDNDCDGAADDADPNCIECIADADCDDRNPCTEDRCTGFVCDNAVKDDGTHCDDGQYCTVREQCLDGVCSGEPRSCGELAGACLDGICLEDEDRCVARARPDGTGCEDGLFCTVGDKCVSGACRGGDRDCDDDDPCTEDACDEAQKACTETLVPKPGAEGPAGHASCTNGADDDCDRAVDLDDTDCRECTADTDCDDGNACTDDGCRAGECRNAAVPDGRGCNDGRWCTDVDTCRAGLCEGSTRDCSGEGDACHDGVCDEDGQACVAVQENDGTPCDDGLYCTVNDECTGGVCGGATRDCQDDDVCTAGTCDDDADACVQTRVPNPGAEGPPGDGSCQGGQDEDCDGAVDLDDPDCFDCQADGDCDDSNPCTDDRCLLGVCESQDRDDGAGCDDGQFCNGADTCHGGVCQHAGRDCGDAHDCTDDGCDETADRCVNTVTAGRCLIGGRCHTDFDANPLNECQHCLHAADDDGWTNRGEGSACGDGDYCNGEETCDGSGACVDGAEPCPDTRCREADDRCVECLQDSDCDNGEFCDGDETCDADGNCVGGADPCPGQACREADDQCVSCLGNEDCDNGDYCDGEETCDGSGACLPGADPCPGQLCRESDDRCVECLADGDCDNGDFCDGEETCADGTCLHPGNPCADGHDCTDDDCTEATDSCANPVKTGECLIAGVCRADDEVNPDNDCQRCWYAADALDWSNRPDDTPCDDEVWCNGPDDTCIAGACAAHANPPCDDGYDCTDDDCTEVGQLCDNPVQAGTCLIGTTCYTDADRNPANDCEHCDHATDPAAWTYRGDAQTCDDGLWCDGPDDTCDSGTCSLHANPPCDDGYDCTDDDCTEVGQLCDNPVQAGTCLIGTTCYTDADRNPANDCEHCDHATDPAAWTYRGDAQTCDDGLWCNGPDDTCDSGACSLHANPPCDDGLDCTDDDCTEVGQLCDNPLQAGNCLISGTCYADTDVNPGDFCETCDSATDQTAWTWTPRPAENDLCGNGIDEDCDTVVDGCCQGDGTLAFESDTDIGASPWHIVTADFNRDGIPDLATANRKNDTVSVLLGDGADGRGNGSFTRTPPTDYASAGEPFGLSVGDLDADSHVDIVAANASGTISASVFWNAGDGSFPARSDKAITDTATSATVGDFNADGLLDIAVSTYGESVAVLLNTGSRSFADAAYVTVAGQGTDPRAIVAGDFDADGILDLATANFSSANVTVLYGQGTDGKGTGGFDAPTPASTFAIGAQPTSLAAADFNEDGVLDLASSCMGPNKISVLLGNAGAPGRGDGTFAAVVTYPATGPNPSTPVSVSPVDLDADGILDLVLAAWGGAQAGVMLGNGSDGKGDGSFGGYSGFAVTSNNPAATAVLDATGDGIPDVAVACNEEVSTDVSRVSLLAGQGSGGVGDGSFVVAGSLDTGALPSPAVAADLDGDAILDLALAHAADDEAAAILGTGGGGRGDHGFAAPGWTGAAGVAPGWVEAVDVTGDRVPDLLVASAGSESIGRFTGAGDGSFGAQAPYATDNATVADSTPAMLRAADVNADAVLDLVVADESGNVMVLLGGGDGDGTPDGGFGTASEYAAGAGATTLALGELDGDRILDLVVANRNADTVSVLVGDGAGGRGNGGFVPQAAEPTIAVGDAPVSVALADLDGDGALDVVVANRDDDTLTVLLGDGDGTFTAQAASPLAVGDAPTRVIARDLDGDGRVDLAAACSGDGTVQVLAGNGDGSFSGAAAVSVGGSPVGLAAGHLDGDGRLDLVVTDAGGDRIVILKGGGSCTPPP